MCCRKLLWAGTPGGRQRQPGCSPCHGVPSRTTVQIQHQARAPDFPGTLRVSFLERLADKTLRHGRSLLQVWVPARVTWGRADTDQEGGPTCPALLSMWGPPQQTPPVLLPRPDPPLRSVGGGESSLCGRTRDCPQLCPRPHPHTPVSSRPGRDWDARTQPRGVPLHLPPAAMLGAHEP